MSDASIEKAQILVVCLTERTVLAVQTPRIAFGRLHYGSLQWERIFNRVVKTNLFQLGVWGAVRPQEASGF